MFVAQNGVFLEKEFLSRKDSGSKVHLEEIQDSPPLGKSSTLEVEPNVAPKPAEAPAPRRSTRLHGVVMLLDGEERLPIRTRWEVLILSHGLEP